MASWEIVALNTTTPQLMAPQSGDTYSLPRPLVGAVGTFTTSTPVLDLSQTWNAGGVTFTGMKLNVTDTASASGSRLIDLQVGGVSQIFGTKMGAFVTTGSINSGGNMRLTTDAGVYSIGASSDVILNRDAANTLALRNGTAAQTFNVYNTYTDASNGEWGTISWNSNVFRIGTTNNGTGASRAVYFMQGGNDRWLISTSGHFLANVTNTYDIGTSTTVAAPRNIYAGSAISAGTTLSAANNINIGNGYRLVSPTKGAIGFFTDGVFTFENSAATNSFTITAGAANLATFNGPVNTLVTTVASLPTAGTAGRRAFVTNALAPTFGSAVVGGGAVNVPVYDTGAAWFVG